MKNLSGSKTYIAFKWFDHDFPWKSYSIPAFKSYKFCTSIQFELPFAKNLI